MPEQYGTRRSVDSPKVARDARSPLPIECIDPTTMSHELRTPLNAIQGNLGLLLDGALGPLSRDARSCLGDMQHASRRMLAWVDELLIEVDHAAPARSAERHLDLLNLVRDVLGSAAPDVLDVRPRDARLAVLAPSVWLNATATVIVELHEGISRDRPLMLMLPLVANGTPELRVTWPNFDRHQIRRSRLPLLTAIMEVQGGRLISKDDGLQLYWPAPRRLQSATSAASVGPGAASSSLVGA
jgi:hypothetical protein